MKILITGGAGYIGTELCYKLAALDFISEIIIYDNLSRPNYNLFIGVQKFPNNKIRFEHGDILDSRKLKKVLKGVDAVYHLAAKVTTPFSDQNPHLFEQVNHWGTAELVYAVEESNVQKFYYLSSISVYGAGAEVIDISQSLNPKTYYGISKMRGEEHVLRLAKKKSAYVLRCSNVYGYSKSMRFDAVINKFMFEANYNKRITIHGNGTQIRPFVHIQTVAEVLTNMLANETEAGIYNLAERNLEILEIVETVKKLYPELETLFVNQHFNMRQIKVKPDERLTQLLPKKHLTFEEEMLDFKNNFTF